ncbi:MAG: type II toxin-antitoxin system RelE/ParE family toxin [Parafilimonas sp.]
MKNLYENEQIKGKPLYNKEVINQFRERVLLIEQAENTKQLREFKSLHLEALKGNKKGLYSIRINKQYRLGFKIDKNILNLLEIILIEDSYKHYK